MRRSLRELIDEAKDLVNRLNVDLDDKQKEGCSKICKVINYGGIAVGVGPPGTGKTIIFSRSMRDVLESIADDEALVYVAPTNQLVYEASIRTMALLLSAGFSEKELEDCVRVYGSWFGPTQLERKVKLIFTTGYQPGALRSLSRIKRGAHLMVDEASTMPIHRAFISLSMSLSKALREKNVEFIGSFSVIGDPMQAISTESGRWKHEQLIVYRLLLASLPEDAVKEALENPPSVFELAERYIKDSEVNYYFLNMTYRMPSPSELLVSVPFYARKLTSANVYRASKSVMDVSCENVVRNSRYLGKKLRSVLDNVLTSDVPVVYLKDPGQSYSIEAKRRPKELDEFDWFRATIGAEVSAYLASRTSFRDILVLAPYNEMTLQIRLDVLQRFGKLLEKRVHSIRFATVHSAIGSEADAVVVVMGKEYPGYETSKTIYFQVPELINVQFSRHRAMLVIIGNIEKLAKKFEEQGEHRYVGLLKEALEELRQRGSLLSMNLKDQQ